jgi:mono/diheme cytochrome c family protein
MKNAAMYLLIIIFLALSSTPVHSGEETVDAKSLFEKNCSRCHTIERPKSKKKTKEGWETTVMRMKKVNGCPITDEEAQIIIDYLTRNYGL